MDIHVEAVTCVPLLPTGQPDQSSKVETDINNPLQRKELSLGEVVSKENAEEVVGREKVDDTTREESREECSPEGFVNLLKKRYGIVLTFITALCFAILSVLIRLVLETIQPFQAILMFMPVMTFGSIFLGICQRISIPEKYQCYIWLTLSGSCLSLNTVFFVVSITYIDVADATTILYTSLIFVGIFSWIFLREPLRPFDFLFALLAFVGVTFVARPSFIFGSDGLEATSNSNPIVGIAFALGAAFSITLLYVFIRKQSALEIHTFFSMFFNSTVVVIVSLVAAIVVGNWTKPTPESWMYSLLAGVINLFGQTALYFALKVESATIVTVMLTIEIVFSFIFQFLILQISAVWTSYVGATLVIVACIGITLKNRPPTKTTDLEN
ncbi:solute carrier family 35 member G1-like [Apostichopus japonicus]|uniref:solute carrier family 35 member G1-like n=1 Tax=Stichopus japonicus TaxID=307972 RepID=UPI003AB1C82C